jgi:D-threo-aldose 1-dehydrogenase
VSSVIHAPALPRREIRRTGVHMTTFGFGAAPIAGLYRAVDETTARATIDAAWRGGIRYFDTAPHYGLGLSERRLGEALRDRPRDNVVVSSKVGCLLIPRTPPISRDDELFDVPGDLTRRRDYSRDGVLRSLDATLRRTGLNRVDVLYIHDPDDYWREAVEDTVPALVELREAGVVGAIGVGMNQSAMLARFIRNTDVDVVMLAGRYTLLEQGAADDLLPTALKEGRSVVAAAVFNSGLLAHEQSRHCDVQLPTGIARCARAGTTAAVGLSRAWNAAPGCSDPISPPSPSCRQRRGGHA